MESFIEAISKLNNNKSSSIGKVIEITGNTCKVERENLPTLEDVRLNAIEGDFSNKIIIYPAIGSEVLCLEISGDKEETAIVQYTEIDKVLIEINGAKFEMSGGKFQIKNEEADLKKLHNDWLNELKNAIILTPSGPGRFSLTTKARFDLLKQDNEKLLG